MPMYEVQDSESGRVLRLEGFEPPTDEDLDELFAQYRSAPEETQEKEYLLPGGTKPQNEQQRRYAESLSKGQEKRSGMTNAEVIASDPGYRAFYGGVVEPVIGASQLLNRKVVQPLTGYSGGSRALDALINRNQEIEQSGRQKMGEEDPTGFDPYKLAGGMMVPLGVGAKANVAKTLLERIGIGTGIGGVSAATMPVYGEENQANYDLNKGVQTATGMGVGAGIPVVAAAFLKGAGAFDQLKRPFSEEGIIKDLTDSIHQKLGGSREQIKKALLKSEPSMLGQNPTSGQVIADFARNTNWDIGTDLVRLEKDLSRKGVPGNILRQSKLDELSGQEAYLSKLAGTDEQMTAAKAIRNDRTKHLIDSAKASKEVIDSSPVLAQIDNLIAENKNRSKVTAPLNKLRRMLLTGKADELMPNRSLGEQADNAIVTGPDKSLDFLNLRDSDLPASLRSQPEFSDDAGKLETNAKNLISMNDHIKDMMAKKTEGKNDFDVKVLKKVKDILNKQIETKISEYKSFRNEYKKYSAPINKMEAGKELLSKLKPTEETASPISYIKAVDDATKTLKDSTGFARYKNLEDVFPEEAPMIRDIANSLERNQAAKVQASSVDSFLNEIGESVEPKLPNMLMRETMLANALLRKIGVDKTPEYHRVLAAILADPKKLAKLLEDPATSTMANDVMNQLTKSTGQEAGREIGE